MDRGTARDRPSPYGEGGRFSGKNASGYRSAGACPPRAANHALITVARGPVPRDASRCLNQDLQGHVYNKDIYAGFPAEMTNYRICRIISRAAAKPLLKKNGSSGPLGPACL